MTSFPTPVKLRRTFSIVDLSNHLLSYDLSHSLNKDLVYMMNNRFHMNMYMYISVVKEKEKNECKEK
jgi:hypothetical protein